MTKGAIYGHFSSKEDLLLSAIEAEPVPDWAAALNDQSVPVRERLARFGRAMAVHESVTDKAGLAVELEFTAALLRSPEALRRYGADLVGKLAELAAADEDQPAPPTTALEAWAIGHALLNGLQVYRCVAPEVVTPAVFERAFELLAGLYPGG
jgi:AcrR family transcriptional regulator